MVINILLLLMLVFIILVCLTVLAHIFFMVPYVPTKKCVAAEMIKVARLKTNETVFDIGCGDGRLLFTAEKVAKVRTVGFEIAPLVFLLALIRKIIAGSKAKILFKNFLHARLSDANVIFCYLIPSVMPSLGAKIKKECKKGTRIISNTFKIPGLKPYRILHKNLARKIPTIYVYHV